MTKELNKKTINITIYEHYTNNNIRITFDYDKDIVNLMHELKATDYRIVEGWKLEHFRRSAIWNAGDKEWACDNSIDEIKELLKDYDLNIQYWHLCIHEKDAKKFASILKKGEELYDSCSATGRYGDKTIKEYRIENVESQGFKYKTSVIVFYDKDYNRYEARMDKVDESWFKMHYHSKCEEYLIYEKI